MVISRGERPWLLAEVMPLTAFGSDLFTAGCAVLLLTDLRSLARPDALRLRAAFGLTAAEARLAARLASGDGINAAAIALGISRETARTQLRAVFAKTNTHRQAESHARQPPSAVRQDDRSVGAYRRPEGAGLRCWRALRENAMEVRSRK